jgi:hypothetical protein
MPGNLYSVSVQVDDGEPLLIAELKTERGALRRALREARDRGTKAFFISGGGRELEIKEEGR